MSEFGYLKNPRENRVTRLFCVQINLLFILGKAHKVTLNIFMYIHKFQIQGFTK